MFVFLSSERFDAQLNPDLHKRDGLTFKLKIVIALI